MNTSFTLFPTAIGHCGIAWGERGIVGLWLPETDERRTRAPSAPPSAGRRRVGSAARRARRDREDRRAPLRRTPRPRATSSSISTPSPPSTGACTPSRGRSRRADPHLRRGRIEARRSAAGARGGTSARPESVSDRRALPSRARGARTERRILRAGRHFDEAAASRDRGRALSGDPDPLLTGSPAPLR